MRTLIPVLFTLAFVSMAHAQNESAEQKAVEIRQSIFRLMEWNYAPTIGEMLKNKMKYDAAVV